MYDNIEDDIDFVNYNTDDSDELDDEDENTQGVGETVTGSKMTDPLLPMDEFTYKKRNIGEFVQNDIQKFINSKTSFLTSDYKIYKLNKDGFEKIGGF